MPDLSGEFGGGDPGMSDLGGVGDFGAGDVAGEVTLAGLAISVAVTMGTPVRRRWPGSTRNLPGSSSGRCSPGHVQCGWCRRTRLRGRRW